jgi:hypothetical protein
LVRNRDNFSHKQYNRNFATKVQLYKVAFIGPQKKTKLSKKQIVISFREQGFLTILQLGSLNQPDAQAREKFKAESPKNRE